MLFWIVGAVAALAVYSYFTDSGDQNDPPPSYTPPSHPPPRPYQPPQPPLRRRDENRQTVDPPRKVAAPVKVEAADSASLRKQANREGDLMKLYYQESKQAYERRDHADSKALKEQGKRHETAMENLHAKASASIYKENNKDRPAGEIDLHGLHVKEAIAYSETAIKEARRRGDDEIRLIVGKGSHSDGGVSRLRPAIQDHLRDHWHGILAEVDPRNPGVLIVQVDGW